MGRDMKPNETTTLSDMLELNLQKHMEKCVKYVCVHVHPCSSVSVSVCLSVCLFICLLYVCIGFQRLCKLVTFPQVGGDQFCRQ